MQHKGGIVRVQYIKLTMEATFSEKIKKIKEINKKEEWSNEEKYKRIMQVMVEKESKLEEEESKLEQKELEIRNPRAKDDIPKVESSVNRRTFRQDLQQKGVVCKMDCVMSVVTFVCYQKLDNVRLCLSYLGKLIVHEAERTLQRN